MRKTIIAAVAAVVAIGPIPLIVAAPASACDPQQPGFQTCCNIAPFLRECGGNIGSGSPAAAAVPANVPNDSCAYNLQPPNPSVGAYNGCETARQATGGQ
jgi:hypothetical protein